MLSFAEAFCQVIVSEWEGFIKGDLEHQGFQVLVDGHRRAFLQRDTTRG